MVPAQVILTRVGAPLWLTCIAVSWGFVAACTALIHDFFSFLLLRVLLGLAESGFYPAVWYYIAQWCPKKYFAEAYGTILVTQALSGGIGGIMASIILRLDGVGGIAGWRWLFLVEGILPFILGFRLRSVLPRHHEDAKFLCQQERAWLVARIASENASQTKASEAKSCKDVLSGIFQWKVWYLGIYTTMVNTGLWGLLFWMPLLVKQIFCENVSVSSTSLLAALPNLLGALCIPVMAYHIRLTGKQRLETALPLFASAMSTCLAVFFSVHGSRLPWYACLCIAVTAAFACKASEQSILNCSLEGRTKAVAYSTVNMLGSFGGVLGPLFIGALGTSDNVSDSCMSTHSEGLLVSAGSILCGAVAILLFPSNVEIIVEPAEQELEDESGNPRL
eukprot:gnl/MRDRNA2_/MRDRNA2_71841_c0_seq1.p1 gnl/MRDRNA2_/MRDRNA2_71841_c0~~gnl/MRDRNA2_/MRDRNA2_71841_c0_seq1.p1  ORF type:complete len:444 (+),score=59.05 gnl/MRDRNA2_/MRDRNA2_71841_c0_seq1:159-1334(+)